MFYLLSLLLLTNIYSEIITHCDWDEDTEYVRNNNYEIKANSASDCKNRLTTDDKKIQSRCCYWYRFEKKDEGYCQLITKEEYENIDKFIKYYNLYDDIYVDEKDEEEYKKYLKKHGILKIDCFSNFLKIGLLSIIIFIL